MQRGELVPPRQVDPSIDRALEAVCLKAMALRPVDRYGSCRELADDLERWMADEPVSAWREPFSRRARRWARRNRTTVTAAAVALVAGVVGLAAVLAVQTQAKADLYASLKRETNANTALAERNADLGRSQAAVQARYKLAVEAIETFHTGVSEDFLLKQEQFKEVRDRLLKSASDFYGKLGALLGNESDLASRRALWQANYEVADLTGKVGKPEDALAAHRQVLAAREGLAAASPADPEFDADVGAQPDRHRLLAGGHRPTRRGRGCVPQGRDACWSRWSQRSRSRRRRGLPLQNAGHFSAGSFTLRAATRKRCRSSAWRVRTRRRWPPPTRRRPSPGRSSEGRSTPSPASCGSRTSHWKRRPSIARRWRSSQKLVDDNPSVAEFRSDLALSHDDLGGLLKDAGRKRRPNTARRWRSFRSWLTTTPPSPTTAATWRRATAASAS